MHKHDTLANMISKSRTFLTQHHSAVAIRLLLTSHWHLMSSVCTFTLRLQWVLILLICLKYKYPELSMLKISLGSLTS